MKKHIIFDMDGVLVDSEPLHKEVLENVFNELAIDYTKEYHDTLVGMPSTPKWKKIISDFNLERDISELIELNKSAFYKEIESRDIPVTEGLFSLLDRLDKLNLKKSLASSSPVKLINIIVDRLEIRHHFDYLVSGEEVERGKPFPDIFLKVAELYNIEPSDFLVIEDSHNGVLAAKAAGMTCIGYKNLNSGNQDLTKADIVIDHFDELSDKVLKELD